MAGKTDVRLLRGRQPAEKLMELVWTEDAKASPPVGRNDPCPCGSGKKYKRCCLGKTAAQL